MYNFLVILRDLYPAGLTYNILKKEVNVSLLPKNQLQELIGDKLLRLIKLPEKVKKNFSGFEQSFPQDTLAKNGFEFINGIENNRLNKNVVNLTKK